MCGIIGYVGRQAAVPLLLEGLRRLEYRGYDSAGVAFLESGGLEIHRAVGKIRNLEGILSGRSYEARIGVGHTRWATHGRPSEENAHPHRVGPVVLVHNGIIENYLPLKQALQQEGRVFSSETDTEVIAHLIDREIQRGKSLSQAVRDALRFIRGSYAIVVLSETEPDLLIGARDGCPLVVGLGEGEYFLASDIPAILSYTRDVLFLEDQEMVEVSSGGVQILDLESGTPRTREITRIQWNPVMAEKGGYRHFMLKEIHEQPRALMDTIRGRLSFERGEVVLEDLGVEEETLKRVGRLFLVACGSSWHAALVGKFLIERLARIPVEVDVASEFRYRDPLIDPSDLLVAITQSGETADTLAAIREARKRGGRVWTVCNVVGSTATRESDGVLYTHAGPEIGVAATKTFTTQMVALFLIACHLGRIRGMLNQEEGQRLLEALSRLPQVVEQVLQETHEPLEEMARAYFQYRHFLYLGRGIHYPIALEGALKLKEISYIHAEGYPAGEMKHGPIALIDDQMPVVVLAPRDGTYEKILSNLMEVRARRGRILALVTEGDREVVERADHVLALPDFHPLLMPILISIPLQLLAYHIAVLRGCDVDQPRNLAKSVTVE